MEIFNGEPQGWLYGMTGYYSLRGKALKKTENEVNYEALLGYVDFEVPLKHSKEDGNVEFVSQ